MEERERLKSEVVWSTPRPNGGQSCGKISPEVTLKSDIGFEVTVSLYRSQLRNKELAFSLFELALDEYLRQWKK